MSSHVEEARKKALELIDQDRWAPRSCHECNQAHAHFTQWDDYVVNCFECGRWWLGGVDLTIYDETGDTAPSAE